ncbi:hypothetical protein SELMODRAFT_126835, partial [Selaginella moellendorffii]
QARRLENEIDAKLASFGRPDQSGEDCEAEIERLLKQLQQINSSMQSLMSAIGSDIVSHTLARHLNISHEFLSQEFKRKRAIAKDNREHAELLHSFRSPSERRLEVDPLVQERSSIQRSTAQIDSVVNQAHAALSALSTQRSLFGTIGFKINNVGSILPSVNHVLVAIRRKKNQDTLILSAVISVCTFLMFLYWISK